MITEEKKKKEDPVCYAQSIDFSLRMGCRLLSIVFVRIAQIGRLHNT